MRSDAVSVVTVPATDEMTAALVDWLIRELVPLILAGAGLGRSAATLRDIPVVTARRIRSPSRLRCHARALRKAIGTAEERLACDYVGVIEHPRNGNAGVDVQLARVLPDQVMDAAARLSSDLVEIGSDTASLANRALFVAGAIIGTGRGNLSAPDAYDMVHDSYCRVLASLWSVNRDVQVQSRNR